MAQPISLTSISSQLKDKVDLFICSSSFEERCMVIPDLVANDISTKSNIIFYNTNETSEIIKKAKSIKGILNSGDTELIPLNTSEQIQNVIAINECLDRYLNKGLKTILLETSTFTHETLLVLFRLLYYKRDKFESLYISYLGAEEYSINEQTTNKWLSSGISDIRTVIGYPGVISPARENHLVVLFGFESNRTRSLIEELEFDKISLGFGSEDKSIASKHYQINFERHKKLMDYFRNAYKFELSLIDPIETKKNILKHLDNFPGSNHVIAPMNNKISTVGAALAAIQNSKIQLIYAKAVEYNTEGYSKPGNKGYLFKVI